MATYNSKTYRAIHTDMTDWIIANQDIITDFNEGSGITSFIEAVAQEIEQLYLRTKIGFNNYLFELPFYAFGFTPIPGTKSTGAVVFSRSVVESTEVTIPIGTLVATPSGLLYITTTIGTILSGNLDSNPVFIEAYEIGEEYNVPADSITVIQTAVLGVDSVNNTTSTTYGLDDEPQEDFEIRFNNYILGLGKSNIYGLITGARTVANVRSVTVVEHFPPVDDFWNVTVYIDDGSGGASGALISTVEGILIGDGTEESKGYKAGGINLRVLAPTKVTVDVVIVIYNNGFIEDKPAVETKAIDAITDYINGLFLAEDVIYNQIVDVVMDIVGVYDVSLTTPAANVSIGSSQIARIGTISVSFVDL